MGIKIGNTDISKIYLYINEIINVTGVSLNKSSISLTTIGQTEQLIATITPSNADDQAVTWSSSDTSVATVDNTGLVTCVTPGNATITVTTHDGGYTASCGVTNTQWTLSTDLTQYTSEAQLQALGWSGIATYNRGQYTMSNGNGIEIIGSPRNLVVSLYYYLDSPLTTSNILTMHMIGYGKTGTYSNNTDFGVCNSAGDDVATGARLAGWDSTTGIRISGSIANLAFGYGDFDLTAVINFSTGEITYTGTTTDGIGVINDTKVMNASEISSAIGYRYIRFQIFSGNTSGAGTYIKKAEFLIE